MQTTPPTTESTIIHTPSQPQKKIYGKTFTFQTLELFQMARNADVTKAIHILGQWQNMSNNRHMDT
jgi:hypothetical protein